MQTRQCAGPCGGCYTEHVFFRSHGPNAFGPNRRYHPKCIGCETTERTEQKQRDRVAVKARSTILRHAKKYGLSFKEFCERFGWSVEQLKHDIEHASKNGCAYCHQLFSTLANGLSEVTIDVVDPRKDPFYTTNTKIICRTCNQEKGRTPPEIWAHKLICWAQWERRQEVLKVNPMAWAPLWQGLDR